MQNRWHLIYNPMKAKSLQYLLCVVEWSSQKPFLFSRSFFKSAMPYRLFSNDDKTSTDRLSPSKSLKSRMQNYTLKAWGQLMS